MRRTTTRRTFLQTTAAASAGFFVAAGLPAKESNSPNEKIRFACFGISGKGSSDSADAANHGDIVAICDIDDNKLDGASKKYPTAKKFNDFRKLFDEMAGSIDAVTVSTPDHCHAVIAAMALRHGKHTFCQKPLTRTLHEARVLAQLARENKVATQMGNQGTAGGSLREAAAVLKSGVLGNVSEVHVWTNRPIWPQGGERGKEIPCPEQIHWELFLGPAPYRPYANGYHPFSWRGWWDFGTGALGDMACHTLNMPFMGLDLRDPISVEAESSGHNKDSFPKWSIITYEFPGNGSRGPLKLKWYDGGKRPDRELLGEDVTASGTLIIGDKGKLYAPGDYAEKNYRLIGVDKPEVDYIRSPGHFNEFVHAIHGGEAARSNFPDYAGALTETVLLGNLAVWSGKKVEWDAKNLKATNAPELEPMIRPTYRDGYSL